MKKIAILSALALAVACQPAATDSAPSVFAHASRFVSGDLGQIDTAAVKESAQAALHDVIARDMGGTGREHMVPGKVMTDRNGNLHVRFTQEINGIALEGASMVLHATPEGQVYAANGEFVKVDALPDAPSLPAEYALDSAMASQHIQGVLHDAPALAYVLGQDGIGHLAWRVTVNYENDVGPQRDTIFADTETGELVARHPRFHYAEGTASMDTQDCGNKKSDRFCRTVSTSSAVITTGDSAIDSAHNFALATYDYYWNTFGRDSIDGGGMTLISRVHYDRNYNNAFWDGTQMTYGDGDGVTFAPLSQDADVVAHELTHGVTERSSGLVYQNESGALNEALSDIFGAVVDAQEGATGADVWLIGEDIYTPGTPGDALRDMACPSCVGDYDYYPTRYTGTSDNGGVHWNSGVANLAFKLLVTGGTHPAGATTVDVPGIGMVDAAAIFYEANTMCLTASSNFAAARFCTADALGGAHAAAVHAAWDAVGVPNDPPPEPLPPIALEDGVPLAGQSLELGVVQQYTLAVAANSTVTCETTCNNGDADLYVRFGAAAEPNPSSSNNACASYSSTSSESCTTGATSEDTTLYAAVHAYAAFTDLTIQCTSEAAPPPPEPGQCTELGGSCAEDVDCCSGSCSRGRPDTRVCQ